MKRLLTILTMMVAISASAQSVRVFYNGMPLANNDTIDILVEDEDAVNVFLGYANVSQDDIWVSVKKEELSVLPDATSTFCISTSCCEYQSPEFQILAGDTISDIDGAALHLIYNAPSVGQSLYRFTFQNTDVQTDATVFYARYTHPVGVRAHTQTPVVLAYPNPATVSSFVNISYKVPEATGASLVVRNLVGGEVFRQPVRGEGTLKVDLSGFKPGVYVYGLEVQGGMTGMRKLLVK